MNPILISVLIPSIPSRSKRLGELLGLLEAQRDDRAEVLALTDNRKRHLGAKRNAMMDLAQGEYLCHIDDDDLVSDDFFAILLPELEHGVDLVAYDATCSLNGSVPFVVRTVLGAQNEQPHHLPNGRYSDIIRQPWHWCAWRTEFARQFRFPAHYDGAEDWFWLKQALPAVQSHRKIDATLFHHRYNHAETTFG